MRVIDADYLIDLIESKTDLEFDEITEKALVRMIREQPTIDEKEIIRKTVERIFKRLKAISYREEANDCDPFGDIPHYVVSLSAIRQIIKEECGINE